MSSFPPFGLVSQKRTYSYASGYQAEQVFCLPFVGGFTIGGGTNVDGVYVSVDDFIHTQSLVFYPGSDKLQVTQIQDEPWMDGDIVLPDGFSVARKVTFSYSIVYIDIPWPSNITRPSYRNGTTLKLKTKYAGEFLTIPPDGIDVSSGPAASPNTQASMFISLNEYEIEWDRVQDLSALDFSDYIGGVNDADFFAVGDKGTLLIEGVPQENTTVLSTSNPMAWKSTVTIKQRKIVVDVDHGDNNGTYGWNDWYNPATQKWEPLTLTNGQKPYATAPFGGLFS